MPELALGGCKAEPLGSYLKALGLLRLVATQADVSARGWWEGDVFWLSSSLDRPDVISFLVDRYRPTPLLAPWNGGSGFGPKDAASSPTAVAAVDLVARSSDARLSDYRAAIVAVSELVAAEGWHDREKGEQVALCRNHLPDEAVEWLDTAVVLTADRPRFPPLLGTGGNDGRFDFSANFLQCVADVLGLVPRPRGAASVTDHAEAALFGTAVRLDRGGLGQFDPGASGGVGSSPIGAAPSLANAWDLVLILEGALVFASAAARRLSTGRAAVAVPFMVEASVAGHPTTADESNRGELWAPLWPRPATYGEVARLIGEGRAEFGGHQARSGLDAARAVASLGVDRGVKEFVRHAFLVRNGLATVAVPVGRLTVPTQERPGAALLGTIDSWADQLRRAQNPPAALAPALRRLDAAQYAVAAGDPQPGGSTLLPVLVAVADLEALVLRSGSLAAIRPLRGIEATAWLPLLQDGTYEFELAVALASMRAEYGTPFGALRGLFAGRTDPVRPPTVPGLGLRPLAAMLGAAHARLAIEHPPAAVGPSGPKRWLVLSPTRSTETPVERTGLVAHHAGLDAVSAFVNMKVDDDRLAELLRAFLLLDWRKSKHPVRTTNADRPPTALAVLSAPFHHASLPTPHDRHPEPPVADAAWPRLLLAEHTERVIDDALRRVRIAGIPVGVRDSHSIAAEVNGNGWRLAAACLVPLSQNAIGHALTFVDPTAVRKKSMNIEHPTPSEEAEPS